MSQIDLDRQIESYFRHQLSTEEEDDFFALLRSDRAACDRFVELAELESGLVELFASKEGETRAELAISDAGADPRPGSDSGKRYNTPLRLAKVRHLKRSRESQRTKIILAVVGIAAALILTVWLAAPRRTPEPATQTASQSLQDNDGTVSPSAPATDTTHASSPAAAGSESSESVADPGTTDRTPGQDTVALLPAPEKTAGMERPAVKAPKRAVVPALKERPRVSADAPAQGHVAYLDDLEGPVERSDGEDAKWSQATAGVAVASGDRVRTKFSRVKITYQSGTMLYMNRFTTLIVESKNDHDAVTVVGGEIYVEAADGADGFTAATPHGTAVDIGTKFGVMVRNGGTTILVTEGLVRAATDVDTVDVMAGEEVHLAKRGSIPGMAKQARNVRQRLAWTGTLPPEKRADRDLVAYWSLDEGRGTVVYNRASKDLHGRFIGRPQWVQGHKGFALEFTGANSEGVDIPYTQAIGSLTQGTVMAWVRPAKKYTHHRAWFSAVPNKSDCVFKLLVGCNSFDVWVLNAATGNVIARNPPLTTGSEWAHLAYAVGEESAKMFINGKEVDQLDTPVFFAQSCGTAARFRIGGQAGIKEMTFDGAIDEVRIYRRALNAEEITLEAGLEAKR